MRHKQTRILGCAITLVVMSLSACVSFDYKPPAAPRRADAEDSLRRAEVRRESEARNALRLREQKPADSAAPVTKPVARPVLVRDKLTFTDGSSFFGLVVERGDSLIKVRQPNGLIGVYARQSISSIVRDTLYAAPPAQPKGIDSLQNLKRRIAVVEPEPPSAVSFVLFTGVAVPVGGASELSLGVPFGALFHYFFNKNGGIGISVSALGAAIGVSRTSLSERFPNGPVTTTNWSLGSGLIGAAYHNRTSSDSRFVAFLQLGFSYSQAPSLNSGFTSAVGTPSANALAYQGGLGFITRRFYLGAHYFLTMPTYSVLLNGRLPVDIRASTSLFQLVVGLNL
jgi:hypothetical protein